MVLGSAGAGQGSRSPEDLLVPGRIPWTLGRPIMAKGKTAEIP